MAGSEAKDGNPELRNFEPGTSASIPEQRRASLREFLLILIKTVSCSALLVFRNPNQVFRGGPAGFRDR